MSDLPDSLNEMARRKHSKPFASFEYQADGLEKCKDCIHYDSGGSCFIVEGTVDEKDWCKFWEEK